MYFLNFTEDINQENLKPKRIRIKSDQSQSILPAIYTD